jgi:hypothetical protein
MHMEAPDVSTGGTGVFSFQAEAVQVLDLMVHSYQEPGRSCGS